MGVYPEPPLKLPGGGGGGHFTVLLGNIYCSGLCSPSVTRTFLSCFPSLQIIHLCVFCDILSKGGVQSVVSLFQTQDVFSR